MQLELLYFDGCPHVALVDERLRDALRSVGRNDVVIDRHRIETLEQAARLEFFGSPTVRIDGYDPFTHGGEQVSLSCRLFSTPAGLAGSPTAEQLTDALA